MAQDIFASSPEMGARQRWALQQLQQGSDATPVHHPLQALARALQGALGGYSAYQSDQEDKAAGAAMFNSLPGIGGGPQPSPQPPAPMADAPAAPAQQLASELRGSSPYSGAIANIESGGKYDKLGPVIAPGHQLAGDRAYGKYQVMGSNVGPWTKQYLGQEMSPQEFASNPAAQEAVFKGEFGRLAQKYGPEGASRAWFAGEGGMNKPGRTDQLGTSVAGYGQKFAAGMGTQPPTQVASLGGGMPGGPAPMPPGAAPGMPPAGPLPGPQMAQNGVPGAQPPQALNAPVPNRSSVQIPPDVQATIQRLGADPRTRPQALQLYMQYAKPVENWRQERNADGSIYQRNLTTGKMEAVEKSDVLPDAAVKQKVEIAAAGKPVTTIDQRAPDEFEKEYGTGMGKRALDVISQGDAATQDLQQSALSRAFLSKVKTGSLAPTQATLGAWAKSVGIDPSSLGLDPNLPAINQAAQSAMAQQTVGMIGAGGFPANNFSDADRKFLNSIPANIGNLPEANELLADVRERVAQRKIDRANAWADARSNKQSYETFERDWRKKVAGEDIFADVRAKVEGMQGGKVIPGGDPALKKKYGLD